MEENQRGNETALSLEMDRVNARPIDQEAIARPPLHSIQSKLHACSTESHKERSRANRMDAVESQEHTLFYFL
jgi:hypothetical protein